MNFARAWISRLIERHKRKIARKARADAARLGEKRRVHRQYLNDPLMKAARETLRG